MARRLAFADASTAAAEYAALAGRVLGPVLALDDSAPTAMPGPMVRAAKAFDASTPIRPGQVSVAASVTVRWAFVGHGGGQSSGSG